MTQSKFTGEILKVVGLTLLLTLVDICWNIEKRGNLKLTNILQMIMPEYVIADDDRTNRPKH